MQKINAIIKPRDAGPAVANLQLALLALIENNIIWAIDDPDRPKPENLKEAIDGLNAELAKSTFGEVTKSAVTIIQLRNHLDVEKGLVEEKTAAVLNGYLKSAGLLDEPDAFTFRGTVKDSNGKPQSDLIVRAYAKDLRHQQTLGKEAITDK